MAVMTVMTLHSGLFWGAWGESCGMVLPKVSSTNSLYLENRKLILQYVDNKDLKWFPMQETLRKLDDIPGDAKSDVGNREM
jgi:hypothetical protein